MSHKQLFQPKFKECAVQCASCPFKIGNKHDEVARQLFARNNELAQLQTAHQQAVNERCALLERVACLEGELRKCMGAIGGVLQPLDHEELSQPIFKSCDKAYDSARVVLASVYSAPAGKGRAKL